MDGLRPTREHRKIMLSIVLAKSLFPILWLWLGLLPIRSQESADIEPISLGPRPANAFNPEAIAILRWYQANTAFGSIPLGVGFVNDIAYDGENLWISRTSGVEVVAPYTGASLGFVDCGAKALRLAFDGKHVWVGLHDRSVARVDVRTRTLAGTFPTGVDPFGMAFDGQHVWITSQAQGTVSRLSAVDGTPGPTVSVGASPLELAFDGQSLWVANFQSDDVTKIDAASATVLATFSVGDGPHGIAFDGSQLWVTASLAGDLIRMDRNGRITRTISLAPDIRDLAFDGVHVWVANVTTSEVFKVRVADGAVFGPFATGLNPHGIVFDGVHVWTANYTSGSITKL
jgi:YVTN family beta-propeller protein